MTSLLLIETLKDALEEVQEIKKSGRAGKEILEEELRITKAIDFAENSSINKKEKELKRAKRRSKDYDLVEGDLLGVEEERQRRLESEVNLGLESIKEEFKRFDDEINNFLTDLFEENSIPLPVDDKDPQARASTQKILERVPEEFPKRKSDAILKHVTDAVQKNVDVVQERIGNIEKIEKRLEDVENKMLQVYQAHIENHKGELFHVRDIEEKMKRICDGQVKRMQEVKKNEEKIFQMQMLSQNESAVQKLSEKIRNHGEHIDQIRKNKDYLLNKDLISSAKNLQELVVEETTTSMRNHASKQGSDFRTEMTNYLKHQERIFKERLQHHVLVSQTVLDKQKEKFRKTLAALLVDFKSELDLERSKMKVVQTKQESDDDLKEVLSKTKSVRFQKLKQSKSVKNDTENRIQSLRSMRGKSIRILGEEKDVKKQKKLKKVLKKIDKDIQTLESDLKRQDEVVEMRKQELNTSCW